MRRKIERVLVVGLGSIGKRHLRNIQKRLPQAEVAVLRSSPAQKEYEHSIAEYYLLQDAIDFRPDIAIISNPASLHISVAQALAESGVDLLIEKPLSVDAESIRRLQASISGQKLKVMVGYNLRFSNALRALRAVLESGSCGNILCVRAEVGQYLPDWRPGVDYRQTVSAQRTLGGGALLELSHELDYLCWLLGPPARVFGNIRKVSTLDINVEDLVMAQLDCLCNDRVIPVNLHLDFLQRKASRVCKVICEEGTLLWDAIADRLEKQGPEGVELLYQGGQMRNDTYEKEMDVFVNCVIEDADIPISIDDGLLVLRIVDALKCSAEQKKWVEL